jgi:hypothetical protein
MRLEHIEVDDALADAADRLWPDQTWSEVIDFALGLLIDMTEQANDDRHELTPAEVHVDFIGGGA